MTAVQPCVSARALAGELRLRFAPDGRRTALAAAERTPPWHVQRLLYLDPDWPALAHAALLTGVAGLFAGDRLALHVDVEPGAAVALTTPTMTRAFAMPAGHGETATRLRVAAGGYLEYLPEPTLLCRDADLRQSLVVELDPAARAVVGETLCFGRAAYGERHAYRALSQRVEITVAGDLVLAEALRLDPHAEPAAPGLLGYAAAYGSLHLLGGDPAALPGRLATVRALLGARTDLTAGASLLPGERGIAVRVLGPAPHAVQAVLRSVAAAFRRWDWEDMPRYPAAGVPTRASS